jgi:hypothetical protein
MPSVIILNVIYAEVINEVHFCCVIMLNDIMTSATMVNDIKLIVIVLNNIMLKDIMLYVI